MRAGPLSSPKVYPITRFTSTCLLILPLMGIVFVSFAFLTLLPAINESIADSVVSILIAMARFAGIFPSGNAPTKFEGASDGRPEKHSRQRIS